MIRRPSAVALVAAVLGATLALATTGSAAQGEVGPAFSETPNGRLLHPAGRMTTVGDFPSGGALSPDGRFYWAVDSGHGRDAVDIVDVATGKLTQDLQLPGAYGGIAFSPDGRHAYVSGEPDGVDAPLGPVKATDGDAIHVYAIDATGHAVEQSPIILPPTTGGAAQEEEANPVSDIYQPPGPGPSSGLGWPIGLAVTPDGNRLVVALNQADQAAVVDLATGLSSLVKVGRYPFGVVIADGSAFVSNELDGTISRIDLGSLTVTATIRVGKSESHPEGMVVDSARHLLYVAVANRDVVAVVDLADNAVDYDADVGRVDSTTGLREGVGTSPVAVALSPDRRTLYVADAGEDAVAVVTTVPRDGLGAFRVVGRIPTAAYPTGVAVTPDGTDLVWLAAKGLGAGPNPLYGYHPAASQNAPYGQYDIDMLLGRVGVLPVPTDGELRQMAKIVDADVRPADFTPAPTDTVVQSASGGPSTQIKHIFYIVKENRTYDQIFGTDPRGDGDPALELFDDNGVKGPAGGITPNAHALATMFPLLDHVFADSEVSVDGHLITAGGYAIDFVQRGLQANYSNRGYNLNAGQDPVTFPPNDFIFDQLVRQGISFANYGELNGGVLPEGDDGRPTYTRSAAAFVNGYPLFFGCDNDGLAPVTATDHAVACSTDSGTLGPLGAAVATSRFDSFQAALDLQIATGTVPAFSYLTLPNDHTNGLSLDYPTPQALVADNDLGLGQIVDLISHSPIWSSSAIFVVEDDSQDGADHIDAHRMPAFVISPWARHGAVIHTRYDQYSVLRTMELMLGLRPLSMYDGLAEPMYDAFIPSDQTPDRATYTAITPTQSLDAVNLRAPTGIDAVLPFDIPDMVPQRLFDAALYASEGKSAPKPGPDASPFEEWRAEGALQEYKEDPGLVRLWLIAHTPDV